MTLFDFERGNYCDRKTCYYLLKSGKVKAGKIICRESTDDRIHFYFIHSSQLIKYKSAERKKDLNTLRLLRQQINLEEFLSEVKEVKEMHA